MFWMYCLQLGVSNSISTHIFPRDMLIKAKNIGVRVLGVVVFIMAEKHILRRYEKPNRVCDAWINPSLIQWIIHPLNICNTYLIA